jgi:hypothetical protein
MISLSCSTEKVTGLFGRPIVPTCDFTDWKTDNDKFDAQIEKVVKALRTDDGGREPAPVPKL